jgi:hypothetical protein
MDPRVEPVGDRATESFGSERTVAALLRQYNDPIYSFPELSSVGFDPSHVWIEYDQRSRVLAVDGTVSLRTGRICWLTHI